MSRVAPLNLESLGKIPVDSIRILLERKTLLFCLYRICAFQSYSVCLYFRLAQAISTQLILSGYDNEPGLSYFEDKCCALPCVVLGLLETYPLGLCTVLRRDTLSFWTRRSCGKALESYQSLSGLAFILTAQWVGY